MAIDFAVVPRGYSFTGLTPNGDGKKWTAKYGALGAIVFGNLGIMDGVNEKGLAVGAFYFPTMAEYTPTTPDNQGKSMSSIDFSNWILTSFANVDEVRTAVEAGEAIVAPTLLPGWPPTVQPFHWIVYDKSGKSLVIEPIDGKLVVTDNPLGVLTNSPSFDWHMTNLRNYIALNPRDVPPVKFDGKTLPELRHGRRHARACRATSRRPRASCAPPCSAPPPSRSPTPRPASSTASTCSTTSTFLTASSRDEGGGVHADQTIFTVMRDPQALRMYYKSFEDQTIRMVDLNRFDLDAKEVMRLPTATDTQPVVDMSGKFLAKKTAANAD